MKQGADEQDKGVEPYFHDGVAEPESPNEFLLKLLRETKDDPYASYPDIPSGETLESLRAKVPDRRGKIKSVFERISQITNHMAESYKSICNENQLDPGTISIYVVGGRVRRKPLLHSSDVDIVITVENESGGLQPNYSLKNGDSQELIQKKTTARRQFVAALEKGFENLDLLEKDEKGEFTGWILEPKGYGFADTATRQEWAEGVRAEGADTQQVAVLVYRG